MVAAKRASRPTTATPLRTKIVAIVTFVASFPWWVPGLAPDTFARVSRPTPSRQNLGKA
jgi:hypothetical protein